MSGRICLITGGSSGVGLAVARGLARQGARLVLAARRRERLERARRELLQAAPSAAVDLLEVDLSRPDSVRRAAREFLERFPALHVLLLSAGAGETKRQVTPEGFERTLATEVLGHFQLTALLAPRLRESAPARVLTVAGTLAPLRLMRFDLDDLQLEKRYHWVRAKLRAVLGKVLLTLELARRLQGSGVTANAFHPGLVRSDLTRHLPWYVRLPAALGRAAMSPECPLGVYLASSPEVEGVSGWFFEGRKPIAFSSRRFDSAARARELWEVVEDLTGLTVP